MSNCIEIGFERIGTPIELSYRRIGKPLDLSFSRADEPALMSFERADIPAKLSFSRLWEEVSIRFTKVCSVSDDFYITIPMEHIWLTPDNDFSENVEVYANVYWTIE